MELAGDLQMKAIVLNLIGRSYFSLGDYQKALDYHLQALPVARAASDLQTEAATLTNIGDGYRLTDRERESGGVSHPGGHGMAELTRSSRRMEALNVLARVYFQMGDQYRSLSSFDHALQLTRILSDKSPEVETLGGMGLSYYVLGENEKAAEIWKQELVLVRSGYQTDREARVLGMLGSVSQCVG